MRKFIAILALLIAGIRGFAQDSKVALPFLALNQNAVSSAMGGAFLGSTSVSGFFANPAIASFSQERFDAAAGWSLPGGSGTNYLNISGGTHLSRIYLTVGASYGIGRTYESMASIESEPSKYRATDLKAGAGVGVKVCEYLAMGANMYYAGQFLSQYSHPGAFGCDLFVTGRYAGLTATLAANSLGTALKATGEPGKYSLPSSVAMGLGYAITVKEGHDLELLADAGYYLHRDFYVSAGACYRLLGMTSFRAGFHYGRLIPAYGSFGTGIIFKGAEIDIAVTTGGTAATTGASVTIGYRF